MTTEHVDEQLPVEQVGLHELDPLAHLGEALVAPREIGDDSDHLVAARQQQLGEVGAVLATDAGDQRLQCNLRTYPQASLSPSERRETITSAYTTAPSSAAGTGESATESAPNASPAAAPTASARRASPTTAIERVRGATVASRPAAIASVARPSATASPGWPHSDRRPIESGRHRAKPPAASGTSVRRRSATKTSGNVTANVTQASIHSDRYATRWPSSRPTPPP